ncbi:S-layer homology domain-containing protein [Bacillus sp. FJAT-53711]|uniref:S-layer homology domain-containing protein n=1 Tax=Bacillus yunxiaonensis TaxID=3127665 RepID=A0ABU8FYH0_9BACI
MRKKIKKRFQSSFIVLLFLSLLFNSVPIYAIGDNVNTATKPSVSTIDNNEIVFRDIPTTHWAYKEIKLLKELKIVSGKDGEIFGPEDRLTREQFLTMIVLQQSYDFINGKQTFKDVPTNRWSNKYIETALKQGLITKEEYGANFQPEKEITREEMAIILAKVLKLAEVNEEVPFQDKNDFSKNPKLIAALVKAKIIAGYPDGTFKPKQSLARAEAAAVVVRVIEYENVFDDVPKNHWAYKEIKRLNELKIISGKGNRIFGPEDRLTREQFLTMIVRQQKYKLVEGKETFQDVPVNKWSNVYIETALKESIIDQKDYGVTFNPEQEITREEMALITAKVLKLTEVNEEVSFQDKDQFSKNIKLIAALVKAKIITGYPDGTFKPKQSLARAEAAAVVSKAIDYKKDEPTTGGGGGTTQPEKEKDKADVVYKKNVYEIAEKYMKDIKKIQDDTLVFKNEAATLQPLKVGNILILPSTKEFPMGLAVKITSITAGDNGSKSVKVVTPEASEVVEKLDVKGSMDVTPENATPVFLAEGVTLTNQQPLVKKQSFSYPMEDILKKNLEPAGNTLQLLKSNLDPKAEFSMKLDVKLKQKDLIGGKSDYGDSVLGVEGEIKISDVHIEYEDVNNLSDLKYIMEMKIEKSLKTSIKYENCKGTGKSCEDVIDDEWRELLTKPYEEWKDQVEKKKLKIRGLNEPLFVFHVQNPTNPIFGALIEGYLVVKADLTIGVEVGVKEVDSYRIGYEKGKEIRKHENDGLKFEGSGNAKIEGNLGIGAKGGLTIANLILVGAFIEGGAQIEGEIRESGIADLKLDQLDELDVLQNGRAGFCGKISLALYAKAGLEASLIIYKDAKLNIELLGKVEPFGGWNSCEKTTLQANKQNLRLEEGEQGNLKVFKKEFDDDQLQLQTKELSKKEEIRVTSKDNNLVGVKKEGANDFSVRVKPNAKENQKVNLVFELVDDGEVKKEIEVPVYIVKPTKLRVSPEKAFVMKKQKEPLNIELVIPVPKEIIQKQKEAGRPIDDYYHKKISDSNLVSYKSLKDFVAVNKTGEITVKDDAKLGDTTEVQVQYKDLHGKVSVQVSGSEEDKNAISGLSLESAKQLILDAEKHADYILRAAISSQEEESFGDLQKQLSKYYEPTFTEKQFEKAYKYNRQWILDPYYLYPVTNVYHTDAIQTFSNVAETPSTLSVKVSVPIKEDPTQSFTYNYDLVKKDGSWYLENIK